MQFSDVFLDLKRKEGDSEADALVSMTFDTGRSRELYSYLVLSRDGVAGADTLPEVRDFLLTETPFPTWFDEARLERGQQFFRKYALDVMTLLGAMSLPYCYAASPGNKAIYITEKMRKHPGKRLLETAHFIIEVMKTEAFHPGGNGFFEARKTRLIHALVRHYIRNRTNWDDAWGVPVNQEDMAGTNLAFSYIIVTGMEQSEFPLSTQEKDDFLYAWRFIGYLLRIDEALLPQSMAEAQRLEEAIRRRHFKISEEGPMLTNELINHYRESFPAVAGYFVDSQIRYFIGPEVASLLGLPAQPLKDRLVLWMNRIRKRFNRTFVNPFSYRIMMHNHFKLKKKYTTTG